MRTLLVLLFFSATAYAGDIINAPMADVRFKLAASLTGDGWQLVDPAGNAPSELPAIAGAGAA